MSTPLYHEYVPEDLNKETLMQDEDFVNDAAYFLIDRGGYGAEELDTDDKVYDAYMEHFRFQNVNEVTALKDMAYAQEADDESRARMGRLMDTFDNMDSDLGWAAAGDYLEGVFKAPSTYAGIFTGGAAKAGQLAAQQGLKFGVRQALKEGMKTAGKSVLIEAPVAVGTVAAQEQTRVETGIKDEIDLGAMGFAGLASTVAPALVGLGTGTQSALRSFQAEEIVRATGKQDIDAIQVGNKVSQTILKGGSKKDAKEKAKTAKAILNTLTLDDVTKKALEDTVPEELAAGSKIAEKLGKKGSNTTAAIDTQLLQNIATAGARVYHLIPPRLKEGSLTDRIKAGSKEDLAERFTSRISRGLREGVLPKDKLQKILDEHNVSSEQLGTIMANDAAAIIAAEASRAGKVLGGLSAAKGAAKRAVAKLQVELNEIDDGLLNMGDFTSKALRRVEEETGINKLGQAGEGLRNLNKARIGLMTVQAATTVRNTTNGYMRNFVYTLDNLGSGLINYAGGNLRKLTTIPKSEAAKQAENAVKLGRAQMRVGADGLLFKDLVFGMNSASTTALTRLMKDERFGASEVARQLFKDMGDVANTTGTEKGILGLARKLNTFNTMSDNMFKRAIFARELDIAIRASSDNAQNLASTLKAGNFNKIPKQNLADAMEKALDFTYQTGKFKGKDGIFNSAAQTFIEFGQTTGGSLAIPFPRYMVNQFRFVYEHAPVFGMYDMGGILNKSSYADRAGKQLSGLALLSTFAAVRSQFGDESTGPYEYKDPTSNDLFDMRASLGPFAAFAMFADYLYRTNPEIPGMGKLHDNDKVASDMPYSAKEFITALTGGQGRAGTQLDIIDGTVDVMINGIENGLSEDLVFEAGAKAIGNYFNTYTVGAGVIKDLVTTVDPRFRQVADNTDVSPLGYMLKQATRSFPQMTGDENQGSLLGTGYTGLGPKRDQLESPTRGGGLRSINAFLKQITGLTPKQSKNYVEKELNRLKFEYYEISPKNIKLDKPLTNEARGLMGEFMDREVGRYIAGPEYNGLASDKIKRAKLKEIVDKVRGEARNIVLDPENTGVATGKLTDAERNRSLKVLYLNKIPSGDRMVIEETYKAENNGRTIADDDAWEEAIKLYNQSKDTF